MESVELKPTVFYILEYHRITDLNADLLTKAQNGFSRAVSLGVAVVIIVFRLMMKLIMICIFYCPKRSVTARDFLNFVSKC